MKYVSYNTDIFECLINSKVIPIVTKKYMNNTCIKLPNL